MNRLFSTPKTRDLAEALASQSSEVISMWTSSRDGRALPLPIQNMDRAQNKNALIRRDNIWLYLRGKSPSDNRG